MIPGYQKPAKSHFAHYVVRMMTKAIATHTIGADGFALVCMVAHQWDTIRYSRPVSYSNSVLMHLMGINSKCTLYRVERKCIAAGWLMKHSLGKRKNPVYWVTVPTHASELPDTVTDEFYDDDDTKNDTQTGLEHLPTPKSVKICTIRDTKTGLEAILKQDSINPLPFPSPNPNSSRQGETSQETNPKTPDEDIFAGQASTLTDRELIRPLAFWVRWRAGTEDDTADNVSTLATLVRLHGPSVVRAAAEGLKATLGRKAWPDEVGETLADSGHPDTPPEPQVHPDCVQAITIAHRIGYDATQAIVDIGGVRPGDLGDLCAALRDNPPMARVLIEATK